MRKSKIITDLPYPAASPEVPLADCQARASAVRLSFLKGALVGSNINNS
jgi:hypothetical protein